MAGGPVYPEAVHPYPPLTACTPRVAVYPGCTCPGTPCTGTRAPYTRYLVLDYVSDQYESETSTGTRLGSASARPITYYILVTWDSKTCETIRAKTGPRPVRPRTSLGLASGSTKTVIELGLAKAEARGRGRS